MVNSCCLAVLNAFAGFGSSDQTGWTRLAFWPVFPVLIDRSGMEGILENERRTRYRPHSAA
jgi:hypothetical protein